MRGLGPAISPHRVEGAAMVGRGPQSNHPGFERDGQVCTALQGKSTSEGLLFFLGVSTQEEKIGKWQMILARGKATNAGTHYNGEELPIAGRQ